MTLFDSTYILTHSLHVTDSHCTLGWHSKEYHHPSLYPVVQTEKEGTKEGSQHSKRLTYAKSVTITPLTVQDKHIRYMPSFLIQILMSLSATNGQHSHVIKVETLATGLNIFHVPALGRHRVQVHWEHVPISFNLRTEQDQSEDLGWNIGKVFSPS